MSESPDKFHLWTGISVVAGALRRRVFIDQGYFEWTPNFYIIFVAPPGIVSKSTTAAIGMRLLREIPTIKFGPNVVTWQALVTNFAAAREMFERANGAIEPMSAMTIVSSELGNLLNPQEREMVDLLVSLWDCERGSLTKATKTMGDDKVENPWINILGCTTPDWISGTFPEYMIGGGLTSRCVFVYGEEKRRLVAYPGLAMPSTSGDLKAKLVEDLLAISTIEGQYKLTREAVAWGEMWYASHYEKNSHSIADTRMKGYIARKQTHLHKVAMILAAARSDVLEIAEEHLVEALGVLEAAETDMPKVFAHIGLTNETRAIHTVVALVRRSGGIKYHAVYRNLCSTLTLGQFEEVVRSALKTGYISLHGDVLLPGDAPIPDAPTAVPSAHTAPSLESLELQAPTLLPQTSFGQ